MFKKILHLRSKKDYFVSNFNNFIYIINLIIVIMMWLSLFLFICLWVQFLIVERFLVKMLIHHTHLKLNCQPDRIKSTPLLLFYVLIITDRYYYNNSNNNIIKDINIINVINIIDIINVIDIINDIFYLLYNVNNFFKLVYLYSLYRFRYSSI